MTPSLNTDDEQLTMSE